jgi:hypothetical protein
MFKHLKAWRKLNIVEKRDLLKKHYPNPSNKWLVTNQMIFEIYNKEVVNKSVTK